MILFLDIDGVLHPDPPQPDQRLRSLPRLISGTAIKVTTLFPGYIRTEINSFAKKLPFEVDEVTGCKAMVEAIEREVAEACVPAWPWALFRYIMKAAPDSVLARMV